MSDSVWRLKIICVIARAVLCFMCNPLALNASCFIRMTELCPICVHARLHHSKYFKTHLVIRFILLFLLLWFNLFNRLWLLINKRIVIACLVDLLLVSVQDP